jgi:hypothetical protein
MNIVKAIKRDKDYVCVTLYGRCGKENTNGQRRSEVKSAQVFLRKGTLKFKHAV